MILGRRLPDLYAKLATTAALLVLASGTALGTEITTPSRASGAPLDAAPAAALDRWLGRIGPGVRSADPRSTPLVTAGDGVVHASLGTAYGAELPPLVVRTESGTSMPGGYDVVIGSYVGAALAERLAAVASPADGGLAGGTRFDVRPSDRNAITLPGTVVDRLVLRVVRTPEPSTLALFAAGLAGLAVVVRRRRRRARADAE